MFTISYLPIYIQLTNKIFTIQTHIQNKEVFQVNIMLINKIFNELSMIHLYLN